MAKIRDEETRSLKLFDGAFYFLLALALLTGAIAFWLAGPATLVEGSRQLLSDLLMILPQVLLGILVGSLFTVLVPREVVGRLLGQQSSLRGIVIASIIGAIMPGGPFASFPLVYALARSGAGVGALIAFLVAWAAVGVHRLIIWEIPFMGADFAALRFVSSLPLPIVAGLLADKLSQSVSRLHMNWD